jgi:hypothetical protein
MSIAYQKMNLFKIGFKKNMLQMSYVHVIILNIIVELICYIRTIIAAIVLTFIENSTLHNFD